LRVSDIPRTFKKLNLPVLTLFVSIIAPYMQDSFLRCHFNELKEFQFFIQPEIYKCCADYKAFPGKKIYAFSLVGRVPEVFDSLQNNRFRKFLHLVL
jgi:hypothetical protein